MCGFLVSAGSPVTIEVWDEASAKLDHRGPDDRRSVNIGSGLMDFHRLSIMDLSTNGMQPFVLSGWSLVCNGEIFNYQDLKHLTGTYRYTSGSDCEVLLPLWLQRGPQMFPLLDAEFAMVALNEQGEVLAARDPIGIRPLFYGYHEGVIAFASEAKGLVKFCDKVMPFPPGHYYLNGQFIAYTDLYDERPWITTEAQAQTVIHDDLVAAVKKRMMSDAKVGYLLSGGLDSSLVCAIAARLSDQPIRTFAIGMDTDAIDLKYARMVADHLHSEHHEIIMTMEDVLQALPKVIQTLETWDITTIRASLGMYLLCKGIHETTDVKVLLSGEISDELFGYKYTDFAPSPEAFQAESIKRLQELYVYDVLRADRCISAFALEARVPFGDLTFVRDVLRIDPKLKMNNHGIGKYLLRMAFAQGDWLPEQILWRQKAAFSDAVGHSMVDQLKARAVALYPNFDKDVAHQKYPYCSPISAESMWYRDLFESYYPGRAGWIPDYWMPNKDWPGCNVDDPSARVLANYGDSGV